MSDDYRDLSNGGSLSSDSEPEIANAALRVAVDARVPEIAESVWSKISERVGKKSDFIVLQAPIADCSAAIFCVVAEDFANDEAARALEVRLSQSTAARKFLLQLLRPHDGEARERLTALLAKAGKRGGFVPVPVEKSDEENAAALSDEETLAHQVRFVSNHLLNDPPSLSSVSLKEFVARTAKKNAGRKDKQKKPNNPKKENANALNTAADAVPAEPNARKAARQAAKAAKKTDRAKTKNEPAGERRGKRREKIAAATDVQIAHGAGDESKAARKVKRASLKTERKNKKQSDSADVLSGADSEFGAIAREKNASGKEAEKAARQAARAERQAARAKRTEEKRTATREPLSKEERKQKRVEKIQERKVRAERGDTDSEDDSNARAPRIVFDSLGESTAAKLQASLERFCKNTDVAVKWLSEDRRSDVRIYGFDGSVSAAEITARLESIAKDTTKLRIFVGRVGLAGADGALPFEAENKAIAAVAAACEGTYIDLASAFRRCGTDKMLQGSDFSDAGYDFVATAILGAVGGRLSKFALPRPPQLVPQDLADAQTLAETPLQWLSQLSWNAPLPPKLLWARADKESVAAFIDQKAVLSEEETLDLNVPVKWPTECAGRGEEAQAFGLEFLIGPLAYWYSKANGRSTGDVAEIDALLKERGTVASEILSLAGKIILDFAQSHPLSASAAWEENSVSRRSRVLILYVLCCKMALKRKVKFDEAVCASVLRLLLESIEVLRSDDFYVPCSIDGVRQDSLLIGLALALRKSPYAENLLSESLNRLKRLQIEPGLTAEGVWRYGSVSDHFALLAEIKTLLEDFDQSDVALIEPVAAAAKKMTVFAEAMMKSDGAPPAMGDSKQKSVARKLTGMRRALAGAGFSKAAPSRKAPPPPRMTETYVFREAQYFVSHSTKKISPESSLVILHADPESLVQSDPGGVTLVFAHAATDLLVRAEAPDGAKRREKEIHCDPALRNGYHVNGAGFLLDNGIKRDAARLVKSWRGPDWAAAKSIDEINPAASIKRVVVHLKAAHALIVVDELEAKQDEPADFEQFWHVAPGFTQSPSTGVLHFAAEGSGTLTAAFDTQGSTAVEVSESAGPAVRRSVRLRNGVVASLFQWSEAPAPASITVANGAPGDWTVMASGVGFDVQLGLVGDEFRCESKA
jgi:hypothetical protein